MSQALKEQRKALKISLTKAIFSVLTSNPKLKDKKVIKSIDKAVAAITKKITKVEKVKTEKSPSEKAKKVVAKKAKLSVKPKAAKPVVKRKTAVSGGRRQFNAR